MAVEILPKGGSVNIRAKAPNLTKAMIGVGWDVASTDAKPFDLDLSAVLLGTDGKVLDGGKAVVYYDNKDYSMNGVNVVHHTGDNITGAGEGDDEQIIFDLANMPAEVARISLIVNIYDAVARGQKFGQVSNSFVRLVDDTSKEELARHNLQAEYAENTAVVVGQLVREADGSFKFEATAKGVNGDLAEVIRAEGME